MNGESRPLGTKFVHRALGRIAGPSCSGNACPSVTETVRSIPLGIVRYCKIGMRAVSTHALPRGVRLDILLLEGSGDAPCRVRGRVIWTSESSLMDRWVHCGIVFEGPIPAGLRETIERAEPTPVARIAG